MVRTTFILSLAAILLFTACGTDDHLREVAQVERLQQRVDSAEMIFLSWNLDSLNRANKAIQERVDRVVKIINQKDIMLEMEQANVMADFKSSGKAFKKMDVNMPRILEEISYSRKQLGTLKNDLQSSTVDKGKMYDYLMQEDKATSTLLNTVRDMDDSFAASRDRVMALGPRVDALLKELEGE